MLSHCGAGEDSWESLGEQGDKTNQSWRRSTLNIHWKDWCWSSNTLTTWCKELNHWKRPWCWERLKAGGEGDDGGWDGWMASPTQWTWVWASFRIWWWTGKPGIAVRGVAESEQLNSATELNWRHWEERISKFHFFFPPTFSFSMKEGWDESWRQGLLGTDFQMWGKREPKP